MLFQTPMRILQPRAILAWPPILIITLGHFPQEDQQEVEEVLLQKYRDLPLLLQVVVGKEPPPPVPMWEPLLPVVVVSRLSYKMQSHLVTPSITTGTLKLIGMHHIKSLWEIYPYFAFSSFFFFPFFGATLADLLNSLASQLLPKLSRIQSVPTLDLQTSQHAWTDSLPYGKLSSRPTIPLF